jgi:molybdopterin/thiamine biosynthesis adenylyltransferase
MRVHIGGVGDGRRRHQVLVGLNSPVETTCDRFHLRYDGALNRQSAVVIGVSGTGLIVAEALARLGLGEVILIDHEAAKSQ